MVRSLLLTTALLTGCASLLSETDKAEPELEAIAPEGERAGASTSPRPAPAREDLELRLAKLWGRVDDLEAQVQAQKERARIMEKALTLGLVPNELRDEDPRPSKIAQLKAESAQGGASPLDIKHPMPSPVVDQGASPAMAVRGESRDIEAYRQLLQKAQDKFNQAEYGQAIVLFNEVGSTFDDSLTEGSHHYWIGLSWYYLKEYRLAEESFQAFQTRYPGSPWVEHAAFYQAKIHQTRGLNRQALDQFQRILDHNPDRDLGEMARAEIERMKEKL